MSPDTANLTVFLIVVSHDALRRAICACIDNAFEQPALREARCVDDALKIAEGERVDVAVVDAMLPGTNGIEGTRALRRLSPLTSVVLVSSYAGAVHEAHAHEAGAEGYVQKRSINKHLIPALRKVLGSSRREKSLVA